MPPELETLVGIDEAGMAEDIDHRTDAIFAVEEAVTVLFPWARTFVDLNRAPEQLPPDHHDGVVKLRTCTGHRVFRDLPPVHLVQEMVERYYRPYHSQLEKWSRSGRVRYALDCHSMAGVGPLYSPDPGRKRPMLCLGNRFGETAPDDLMEALGNCLADAFELDESELAYNHPYAGGYISRRYGGRPIPWIQIEVSRAFYTQDGPYAGRLEDLNLRFQQALEAWLKNSPRL